MPSLCSFVKVAVVRAIKHIQPIQDVFAGMGMYDVEEHCDAKSVSGIDELHQFLWGT
jgi:hypothetical protein